jgi:Ca2+-dependent lipid-binding protein
MNIDFHNPTVLIVAAAIVLLIVIGIALAIHKRNKTTAELRSRFGPEYEVALKEHRDASKAESRLLARVKRVEGLKKREVTEIERERFLRDWQAVQARFVDRPRSAVTEADELVTSVMQARGYPASEFEQRAADISVDYSRLVDSYRSANSVAMRAATDGATTEELRTAMIQYRGLFDELLAVGTPAAESRKPAYTEPAVDAAQRRAS